MKLKLEFWYCPFKDVDITNIGNVHYTYRAFHKLLSTVKVPISFKTLRYVFDIMIIYFIPCCGNTHYVHNIKVFVWLYILSVRYIFFVVASFKIFSLKEL